MTTWQLDHEHPLVEYDDCDTCCYKLDLHASFDVSAACWSYLDTPVVIYSWQHEIPLGYLARDNLVPLYSIDELTNFIKQRKIDITNAQEQAATAALLQQIEQLCQINN